jgi:hypothetical protein
VLRAALLVSVGCLCPPLENVKSVVRPGVTVPSISGLEEDAWLAYHAVVANLVELSFNGGVGPLGVPVKTGLSKLAWRADEFKRIQKDPAFARINGAPDVKETDVKATPPEWILSLPEG